MTHGFYPLFSGSSGNAAVLAMERTRILVDAGLSVRALTGALESVGIAPQTLSGLLITHEHSDHIHGAGGMSRKYDIPIYANAATWEAMEMRIGNIALRNKRIFETNQDFYLQDINILPFCIPHDAADPVGYAFVCKGRKVTMMTDIGHMNASMLDIAASSQCLLIESNHDIEMLRNGRYPAVLKRRILGRNGHLSNDDCAKALIQLFEKNVRNIYLGHLSRENNLESIAMETAVSAYAAHGIQAGRDVFLQVAHAAPQAKDEGAVYG